MRWPERIQPNQTSQHLISLMDLPVTLLDVAGTSFNGPVDGCSLLDLTQEGRAEAGNLWRQDLMCETHGHHGERVVGRALLTDRYRYSVYKHLDVDDREEELYDLKADPYQLDNLVSNPDYQEVVAELDERLDTWRRQTGDTAPISE
jgi:arylsulfatase A-like enzyme